MDKIHRLTMTEEEFARAVGISRITAYRLRKAGKLPHCRVGGKVLYLPKHIEEFLINCERCNDAKAKRRIV